MRAAAGATVDEEPPRIIGERYLLEERIARGGMATVWRAHDEKLARTVAVKLLDAHLARSDDFRERFRREAVNAAKLSHPGIVAVYDAGADGPWVYLVMEFVEGPTLADLVESGPLSVGDAARIGRDVALALGAAAALDVVHRDVKPANVLVDDTGSAKIADFGIAKAGDAADLTRAGTVLGTAAYLAPEQIQGLAVDHRADQYALGCVLYEAVTGRRPFEGATTLDVARERLRTEPLDVRQVRADVPRDVASTIMRALARDPDDRWPDHQSFADALGAHAADASSPVAALDESPAVAGSHSFLRSEGRWLGLVLALVALAVVAVAVGLGTGVIRADGIPSVGALEIGGGEVEEGPDVRPLAVSADALSAFDPQGDQTENDGALSALVDGDPETAWTTEQYFRPAFGGLKEGVGVVVDLGEPREVTSVGLRAPTPGQTVEIRAAEEPAPTLDGWSVVGRTDALAVEERIPVDAESPRYLLIWLTGELPGSAERYEGALAELEIAVAGG